MNLWFHPSLCRRSKALEVEGSNTFCGYADQKNDLQKSPRNKKQPKMTKGRKERKMKTSRISLSRSVSASLLAGLLCCTPLNNPLAQLSLGLGGGASLAGAATVAGATQVGGTASVAAATALAAGSSIAAGSVIAAG